MTSWQSLGKKGVQVVLVSVLKTDESGRVCSVNDTVDLNHPTLTTLKGIRDTSAYVFEIGWDIGLV